MLHADIFFDCNAVQALLYAPEGSDPTFSVFRMTVRNPAEVCYVFCVPPS